MGGQRQRPRREPRHIGPRHNDRSGGGGSDRRGAAAVEADPGSPPHSGPRHTRQGVYPPQRVRFIDASITGRSEIQTRL